MSKQYNVVVVGTDTMVGESLLSLLEEREFPVASVFAVTEEGGGRISFKDKHIKVEALPGFDFAKAELAFFCVDEALAERYAPKAAAAGCIVIDDSPCFRLEEDVPLVVAEVNPQALAQFEQQRIIANPSTGALMLATLLKPLQAAVGIERVNVVTLQAASGKHKAGVEELAEQAAAMFNLKPVEPRVFEAQLAFNMLPRIGAILDDGYSREEMKLAWETAKLLQQEDLLVNATCVRVPVFHGHAMVLHLETAEAITPERAAELLRGAAGIHLAAEDELPTPVGCVGEDEIFVARLRKDHTHPRGLDLWLVADNVRKGAALNSIQSAEILIKEYLA